MQDHHGSIGCLDVAYGDRKAHAACVIAPSWEAKLPVATYACKVTAVEPYIAGEFYRRELPCLLAVLELLPALPDALIIDGYVWLGSGSLPGLGARLHAALGGKTPVIGVAKSPFAGSMCSSGIVPVLRGKSQRPLFVTAAGIAPITAADRVVGMAGAHRIPELLKLTDRLAREGIGSSPPAEHGGH